jgi:hypothetical protein
MMTVHNAAVKRLAADIPGLQLRGFVPTLRKVLTECEECVAGLSGIRIRPDAFWIEPVHNPGFTLVGIVHALEVEDSTPLCVERIRNYCWLWHYLDAGMSLELRLHVYDRYGNNGHELDLREWSRLVGAA